MICLLFVVISGDVRAKCVPAPTKFRTQRTKVSRAINVLGLHMLKQRRPIFGLIRAVGALPHGPTLGVEHFRHLGINFG